MSRTQTACSQDVGQSGKHSLHGSHSSPAISGMNAISLRIPRPMNPTAWAVCELENVTAKLAQCRRNHEMACEKHNCFEDEQHPSEVDPDLLCCGCIEVYNENLRYEEEQARDR